MVFLAGPPNRGRGAVVKVTEAPRDSQQEGSTVIDSEANLREGVSMNGHAHQHQDPQANFQVSFLISLARFLASPEAARHTSLLQT